jgi:Secretory lipase
VRGVAVGGFVTNLPQALLQINGGFASGLIASVLGGVARTSPAVAQAIATYATPAGRAIIANGATQCEVPNVLEYPFLNLDNDLTIPLTQLLALPSLQAAFQGMDLGSMTPTAPLFVYHAVNDELIPIAGTDATVANYCAHGASVTYTRDLLSEHGALAVTGGPAALSWLTGQLTGATQAPGCTTTTVPTMLAEPGQSLPSFLLGDLAGLLDQPVGPGTVF